MKKVFMVACVLMLAGALSMGCSNAGKKAPAEAPAAVEQTDEHAGHNMEAAPAAEPAEAPAAEVAEAPAQEYTFAALCDKVVAETKAGNSYFTDELAQQTKDGCMQGAKAYDASPKATEAIAAFTKVVFDNCAGKSGQEWVMCYASQGEAAGKAAAEAMMQ